MSDWNLIWAKFSVNPFFHFYSFTTRLLETNLFERKWHLTKNYHYFCLSNTHTHNSSDFFLVVVGGGGFTNSDAPSPHPMASKTLKYRLLIFDLRKEQAQGIYFYKKDISMTCNFLLPRWTYNLSESLLSFLTRPHYTLTNCLA